MTNARQHQQMCMLLESGISRRTPEFHY